MKVSVNEDACIGCGLCVSSCDRCFEMKGNVAHVIKTECDDCELKEIADNCPAGAIEITE